VPSHFEWWSKDNTLAEQWSDPNTTDHLHTTPSPLVSKSDPRKNRKESLGDRLGWKCTAHPECRDTSNWFLIACLCVFIGNTNRNSLVQLKETENKQDLLGREIVEALLSSYWYHGRLEVPERKWVQTNYYKFHTFHSVHFHTRPSF